MSGNRKNMYRNFSTAYPNIPIRNAGHPRRMESPLGEGKQPALQDDGIRFYRGVLVAILPSLFIWAMLAGAVWWAWNR